MEKSLVLVKPDGVQRGLVGEVVARLERRGLRLVAAKFMAVSQELAEGCVELGGQPARAISTHASRNTRSRSSVAVCRLGTCDTWYRGGHGAGSVAEAHDAR